MISDLDIWRTAKQLVDQHGGQVVVGVDQGSLLEQGAGPFQQLGVGFGAAGGKERGGKDQRSGHGPA